MDASSNNLLIQMYDKLRETFGNGDNELFQMEMPARLLKMGDYHYDESDSPNALQLKPPSVAEAEFRLVDGMFNLSNLVGGPNGSKMAESYEQVLVGLTPANVENSSAEMDKLVPDQETISEWLHEEVDNFEPPASDLLSMIPADKNLPPMPERIVGEIKHDPRTTPKISRIDLYQKLLDLYETERLRWARAKVAAYDRLLSTYAPVIDAKLDALWSVLMVRGQYNRVRKYISYIDILTAADALQQDKESLRESAMRSIDDTEDIYPVVMTPTNWAKYLSTTVQPEDLLSNVEMTRIRLHEAENDRRFLCMRRDALMSETQDIQALEKATSDAREALQKAEWDMVKGYSDAAVSCIRVYFDIITKEAQDRVAALKTLTDANETELINALQKANVSLPLTPGQWSTLVDMQAKVFENQHNVKATNEKYANAMLAASEARGKDSTTYLRALNEQIQSLSNDIDYYKKTLQASSGDLTAPEATKARETAPSRPPLQDCASVWQRFVFDSTKKTDSSTKLSTSVSHSDWSARLWFANDPVSSSFTCHATTSNTDIQISFRAMKVVIDRPWFNAQLLGQQTKEPFHNSNANKVSAGDPQEVLDQFLKDGHTVRDGPQYMLHSWSTAFVVVKDVHIVMSNKDGFDDDEVNCMRNALADGGDGGGGGGGLCFQASKNATVHGGKITISIRIPAPQILGWVSQLAPEDVSVKAD
ncbi:hypothetical protein B0H63DRAFT_565407 [Podospora didyma]|uniref:Uncharacterized protein n=1 Tax=Podospora didyma TaxID=330526 RepID=A0AAE0K339_9PEZI|nr:hypothetical protein B0H63DRAFT_565407 [Podospora didyma]